MALLHLKQEKSLLKFISILNIVTGLQYLRARYYDTELGSFITIDSYLGNLSEVISQNRYTYANNDPVNNIDPSGHYSVNTRGTSQYYQSTGLNEMRDFMTAAGLWAGQVEATNAFNRAIYCAQNTSFMNYRSINGISQSTANAYIVNGILKAGLTSMNYGCSVPVIPAVSAVKFQNNVNNAKSSANSQIYAIKASKKAQYDAYQAYLRWLEEQRRIQEELAKQQASPYGGMTKSEYAKKLREQYHITSPYSDDYIIRNYGVLNWRISVNNNSSVYHYNGSNQSSNTQIYFNLNKFKDPFFITDTIIENTLSPDTLGLFANSLRNEILNTPRPNNIGLGIWKKHINGELEWVDDVLGEGSKVSKSIKAIPYAMVAIDTTINAYDNWRDGADTTRIVSDASVDIGYGLGSIWASTVAGTAAGTVFPGAGNLAGAVIGFTVGVSLYVVTDVIEIMGSQ